MEQERQNQLVERYQGQKVKVYLNNGAIMVGRADFDGNWMEVVDEAHDRRTSCNLDHVVSIAAI